MSRDRDSTSRDHRRAIVLVLLGLAVAASFAAVSDGFYHADDVDHYLIARDAWSRSDKALNLWGRPGLTIPLMPVERLFGLTGCRLFAAVCFAGVAYLAYRIARRVARGSPTAERFVWLAPALVWLQPLVMTLAQTTLTEAPAALVLTAAVWLALSDRRLAACAALSVVSVTRYELAAFLPAAAILLLAARAREQGGWGAALRSPRVWAGVALLAAAPAAYLAVAAALRMPPEASPLSLLSGASSRSYGRGGWHHMAVRWLIAAGPGVLALAAAGGAARPRRAALPAATAVTILVIHTVLFRYGLFASGGYARFLVPAAGVVAALGAVGVGAGRARAPAAIAFGVLAVATLALLEHEFSPGVKAGAVLAAASLAILALASGAGRGPRRAVAALCLVVIVATAGLLVRPLTLLRDPPRDLDLPLGATASTARLRPSPGLLVRPLAPHSLIEESLLHRCLEGVPSGRPLLTNRPFVRCHRPEAIEERIPDRSRKNWVRAGPGSVYVRGHLRGEGADDDVLVASLRRLGRRIARLEAGPFVVEAYVRE